MLRAVLTRTQSNLICTTCRNNFISRVNSVQKVLPVAAPVFRQFHYTPVQNWWWTPKDDITFVGRTLRKLGFTYIPKSVLKQCGYLIYMKIADELDYMKFFKMLDLPDTYASWFIVSELHVWLICTRLMQDGKEGRIVRNSLIKAMWEYNEAKSKKLEGALPSARRRDLQGLNDQFHAAMIAYDEGLLGDDYILAGEFLIEFQLNVLINCRVITDFFKNRCSMEEIYTPRSNSITFNTKDG
ncbi:Ubiquinol-cytochrome-c reductase complex assembly factor 1 [Orchesella cincta]|uniref:Ubiquinol-cytochrome-c reductase complex assembly factor 1 n=1 Tax=Orchesella cincta TaxID=48709 RepID=A0A1D2MIK0_ORCCI|nr:Ubiquinol-cytochrome-c reductase complex assembly factor 1 [Orchesella cincta]